MPRNPRKKSASGIYHAMLRGINKTQLFYDDDDRCAFIERLTHYKAECGYNLYAYSLMGNHAHLLIEEHEVWLSEIIKRLATSYAHYYNKKYDRSGYVFEGRYKSEAVENEQYLLEVIRYIHNNPIKTGEDFTYWTSFNDYSGEPLLVDTGFVLDMFSSERSAAVEQFIEFLKDRASGADKEAASSFLGKNSSRNIKDSDAIALIKLAANVSFPAELANKDKDVRDKVLKVLRTKGLSVRQLSRLTGISRGVVQRR